MRLTRGIHALLFASLLLASAVQAADAPATSTRLRGTAAAMVLPRYVRPAAYSEDMVIHSQGRDMTMKQTVSGVQSRMDMAFEGKVMITLNPGDGSGDVYVLMPDQKRAIKYTIDPKTLPQAYDSTGADTLGAVPDDFEVEDLGEDKVGDVAAKKFRITSKDGNVVAWFEKSSGAPLRMESEVEGEPAAIEWKNRQVGAQPAELFVMPKGYEVTDMSAMMSGMGGAGAIAKGMGAGMVGGMAQGMAGGLGSTIGGALGGPLGAIAGQYIGGKIGGAVSKKATDAIVK